MFSVPGMRRLTLADFLLVGGCVIIFIVALLLLVSC